MIPSSPTPTRLMRYPMRTACAAIRQGGLRVDGLEAISGLLAAHS